MMQWFKRYFFPQYLDPSSQEFNLSNTIDSYENVRIDETNIFMYNFFIILHVYLFDNKI